MRTVYGTDNYILMCHMYLISVLLSVTANCLYLINSLLIASVNTTQLKCTFIPQDIIDMYTRNKASLYVELLDASQVFDGVDCCNFIELRISRFFLNYAVRLL